MPYSSTDLDTMLNQLQTNNPSLYDVNCSQWSLNAASSEAIFKALKNNTHVISLKFLGNQSSGLIQKLAESIEMHPSLRHIYLGTNGLTDEDFSHLKDSLRKNRSVVETLDISFNRITDKSVKGIIDLIHCNTHIEKMDISFNSISNEGLKTILAALEEHPETPLVELCEADILNQGYLTQDSELIDNFNDFFSRQLNRINRYRA